MGGPKRPTTAEVWTSTRSTKAARNANRKSESRAAGFARVNTSGLYWDAQRALRGERSPSPLPWSHAAVPGGGAGREHLDPLDRLEDLDGTLLHRPGRLARLLAGLARLRLPSLAHTSSACFCPPATVRARWATKSLCTPALGHSERPFNSVWTPVRVSVALRFETLLRGRRVSAHSEGAGGGKSRRRSTPHYAGHVGKGVE